MPSETNNPKPCKVCLVPHDAEIHAATLSVHLWFHDQVTQGFYEEVAEPVVPEAPVTECQVA